MKVKMTPVDDIRQYENNPRINEASVDLVAASIHEFGFQQPIVVDKNMVIIVGHTRYLAAKSIGMTEVPVVVASHLTDEQVKAYRLADNKTAERSVWDMELLNIELGVLDLSDWDMEKFGFDNIQDAMLMQNIDSEEEPKSENLVPYNKSHFLVSVDITNIESVKSVLSLISSIEKISDVEVRKSAN